MAEYRVPVVVEVILERVTNISMGTEIDNVVEFEELADVRRGRAHRHLACSTEPMQATLTCMSWSPPTSSRAR